MTIQAEFLGNLFQGVDSGYVTLVRLIPNGGALSKRAPVADITQAVDEFVEQYKSTLYYNVGICRENLPEKVRGGKESVTHVCCLWADIDLPKTESKKKYPSAEVIASALNDMPIPYTALVHTGGGTHVYWFLNEPAAFDTVDQAVAFEQKYSKPWMTLLKIKLAKYGEFDLDSVYDVSRMLRIPGSMHKNGNQCVVTEAFYDRRYSLEDFEPFLDVIDIEKLLPEHKTVFTKPLDGLVDQTRLDVLVGNSRKFRDIWDGKREFTADKSEGDAAVAYYGIAAGWTDDEVANLMIAWCNKFFPGRVDEKYFRKDSFPGGYLGRTISSVRRLRASESAMESLKSGEVYAIAADAAQAAAEARAEKLPDAGTVSDADGHQSDTSPVGPPAATSAPVKPTEDDMKEAVRNHILIFLSQSLGIPVARWIQMGREDPVYTLVLATGQQIRIGGESDVVDSPTVLGRRIYSECQKQIKPFTKLDWAVLIGKLATIVEVVESPESKLTEMARSGIRHYLDNHKIYGPTEKEACLRKQGIWHDGQQVHIFAASAVRYNNMHGGGIRWKLGEFLNALRQIGFSRETLTFEIDGKRTSTSYWVASHDDYLDIILKNKDKR